MKTALLLSLLLLLVVPAKPESTTYPKTFKCSGYHDAAGLGKKIDLRFEHSATKVIGTVDGINFALYYSIRDGEGSILAQEPDGAEDSATGSGDGRILLFRKTPKGKRYQLICDVALGPDEQ